MDAAETALAGLVEAIRQLQGLTDQVGTFALPAETVDGCAAEAAAVCAELGIPLRFDRATGEPTDFAVRALAGRLAAAAAEFRRAWPSGSPLQPADLAVLAGAARRLWVVAEVRRFRLRRPDGAVITVAETGLPDAPPVVLSPACAMSHLLSRPWLRALADRYHCVVPETRGSSERIENPDDFDARGCGVAEQAADLAALIESLDAGPVHLMALCSGTAPALELAGPATTSGLIHSLSCWHPDVDFGTGSVKSEHQQSLRAVLDLAGESRETAGWMRERLTSGPMAGLPEPAAPLVVRPYVTDELFYRYARLTGATMHYDAGPNAAAVSVPTLVVTSRDDQTAHPAGAHRLAELVTDAELRVAEHGDHLNAFDATEQQVGWLTDFLQRVARVRNGQRRAAQPSGAAR